MAFPRILVMAERAWHQAPWEDINDEKQRDKLKENDWDEFVQTLGFKELPILENRGIRHRVQPPGARLDACVLKANSMYPNHIIETSLDKGRTWVQFCDMTLQVGSHYVQLRTRSIVLQRTSRPIYINLQVDEKLVTNVNNSEWGQNKCLKTVTLISNNGFSQSLSFCYTNCNQC